MPYLRNFSLNFITIFEEGWLSQLVLSASSSQCVDTSESSKLIFASNNKIQLVEDTDAHINHNLTSKNNDPLIV